jgi:hypothetical protein
MNRCFSVPFERIRVSGANWRVGYSNSNGTLTKLSWCKLSRALRKQLFYHSIHLEPSEFAAMQAVLHETDIPTSKGRLRADVQHVFQFHHGEGELNG